LNGPTLAERVAALRPGVPIIRMSGSEVTSQTRPHRIPGSDQSYLQKPFTAGDLIRKVRARADHVHPAAANALILATEYRCAVLPQSAPGRC
jgi:hypothetical protein